MRAGNGFCAYGFFRSRRSAFAAPVLSHKEEGDRSGPHVRARAEVVVFDYYVLHTVALNGFGKDDRFVLAVGMRNRDRLIFGIYGVVEESLREGGKSFLSPALPSEKSKLGIDAAVRLQNGLDVQKRARNSERRGNASASS